MRRNLPKTVSFTKVQILKEVNFGKMQLCQVEHFYNIFVLTFGMIAEHNSNHAQK